MMRSPFAPKYDLLPDVLPIFPLPGALLLPGGQMPLNIFEPRYLAMINAAMAGDRLIGMVQPYDWQGQGQVVNGKPSVYGTGCAGRITSFSETDDGRYLITLSGLIRFDVVEELEEEAGFRRIKPHWARYRQDLEEGEQPCAFDRDRLLNALGRYFDQQGLKADWDVISETDDLSLLTALAMVCPFSESEKQALLEALTAEERAQTMTAILEMAILPQDEQARH